MRVLIFGTVYCDTKEKQELATHWWRLHNEVNPGCDLMMVDSASPLSVTDGVPFNTTTMQLGDNIGHLARKGQDGWGRAFCAGLHYAVTHGYDYVAHIEGDSLFRKPVVKFCEFMEEQTLGAFVCGVNGTRYQEFSWVETGIMFFSVPYIKDSQFVSRYNWPDGKSKQYPNTPEAVIWNMLREDRQLNTVPIRVMRDDKNQLTLDNIRKFDWISHTSPNLFRKFATSLMVPA